MTEPTEGLEKKEQGEQSETTTVTMRNNFYRDSYTRILFVLLLSITLNFGLAGTVLYVVTNPPQPKYFATSINGRITLLT